MLFLSWVSPSSQTIFPHLCREKFWWDSDHFMFALTSFLSLSLSLWDEWQYLANCIFYETLRKGKKPYIYVVKKPFSFNLLKFSKTFSVTMNHFCKSRFFTFSPFFFQCTYVTPSAVQGVVNCAHNCWMRHSSLSTWKCLFLYDHWSQAMLSSVSKCSSVAPVMLITLKVG